MPPERRARQRRANGGPGGYRRYVHDMAAPFPRTTEYNYLLQAAQNGVHNNVPDDNDEPEVADDVDSDDGASLQCNGSDNPSSDNHDDTSDSDSSEPDNEDSDSSENSSATDESESNSDDGSAAASDNGNDSDPDGGNEDHEVNGDEEPGINQIYAEENIERQRELLYQGCPLSIEESDFLIMSFIIRWGLEDKSISDLLELIDCHLPVSVMGSKYLFLKKFPVPDITKIRFTCPHCFQLLPREFEQVQCNNCGNDLERKALKDGGNYFLELSVTHQIRSIVESESLFPRLRRVCRQKDVIGGSVYQNLRATGVIGCNDLTLQWNTDGVSPFKSSKFTVWPIQACINELPYHARRENMILCGLYFGKTKPCINSFLQPFVDELQTLHTHGFQCKFPGEDILRTVKVHTILASVDSVARAMVQGIHQFNGRGGCSFCLRNGMIIPRGRGRARVFAGGLGEPRNLPQHLNALQRLLEYNRHHRRKKKHIEGVKFPSVLLVLPVFDITSSFSPDYLHCALEGVTKQFLKHWMDSAYKRSEWYLSKDNRRTLSARLLAILPPVEITRAPRGLDDLALLKASEFKNFLVYYSIVCLKGLLPAKYLKHWFLLVYGLSVFLKENFSQEEAQKAARALNKFVDDIHRIYPGCIHLYTFNVHLLLHIPEAVEKFGALWASSTFPFEHFNGVLGRLITGTRGISEQVCRYMRLRKISEKGPRVFEHPECPAKGRKLFTSLLCNYRSSQFSRDFDGQLRLFGSPAYYEMSIAEKISAQQLLREGDIDSTAQSFRRMIYRGTVYHANAFDSLRVRNNSTIKMNDGRFICINHILLVEVLASYERKCILMGEEFDLLNEELCVDRDLNLSSRSLFPVCRLSNRTVCCLPQSLSAKCVPVPYENNVCVIPLVNVIERD